MAICRKCKQDHLIADTCKKRTYRIDGVKYEPVKYGDELDDWGADMYRCHDCNVAKGGYHHPGCDIERCPACGGQIISCFCLL